MVRYSHLLALAATSSCAAGGGFQWHSGSSASSGSSPSSVGGSSGGYTDSDDRPSTLVAVPHSSGPKFAALLAKLDDPKPEANFKSADDQDRWRYYRQAVGAPWADFKKTFGIADSAPATIDGDSFEADWYQQLKKDFGATLTGADYWCPKPFDSNQTQNVVWVLQQSKTCTAAIKDSIKAFKCVDDPKQDGLAKFELLQDGTLVFHVHDPHVADSSQDFSAMLEGYASVLPACQKIVDKTLNN